MKLIIFLLAVMPILANADDAFVNGHFKKDGTYVEPYHRTAPDHNVYNNYSTQGNVNPYTGHAGTVDPYKAMQKNNSWNQ